ncbi:MAG TPA: C4-dicarboxylate transporter, partial [Azospirillum sp.]|nr:C4-dicarboxylate transporter [Azospirillum sp.]
DLKAAVDRNSGPALVETFGRVWDEAATSTRKLVLAEGGTITRQSAVDYEAMRTAARAVEEEWVKDMTAKGIDAAALAASARSLAAAH